METNQFVLVTEDEWTLVCKDPKDEVFVQSTRAKDWRWAITDKEEPPTQGAHYVRGYDTLHLPKFKGYLMARAVFRSTRLVVTW